MKLGRFFPSRERWHLGFRPAGSDDPFTEIPAPRGHAYADPFLLDRGTTTSLFFEDLDEKLGRGSIAAVELPHDGQFSEVRTVLKLDHHLSYPQTFSLGQDLWMIPEVASTNAVALYRGSDGGLEWHFETNLIEGVPAFDPTFVQHEGRFYLFMCPTSLVRPIFDELHVYWADDLQGQWRPHPLNPVVKDLSRARPAGRIYTEGGHLIRPGQDCSRTYGGGIRLNRIIELSPTGYEEQPAEGPPRWPASLLNNSHTYDRSKRWEVTDWISRA